MHKILAFAAIAVGLGLTSLPAANAQDLELHLGRGGPEVRLRRDCDPRREDCGGDRYDRDRTDRRSERRQCSPERALDKADRMGLRRARIARIGRQTIDVRGRNWDGDTVVISFGRWDPRCPVLGRDRGY